MKAIICKWILALVVLTAPLGNMVFAQSEAPTWEDYRDTSFSIDGKGSANNPIIVSTAEQLAQIAWLSKSNNFDGKVIQLGADINLKKEVNGKQLQWTPICNDLYFQGTFDGKGHSITGMYIDVTFSNYTFMPERVYYGLFGQSKGLLNNVRLLDATVKLQTVMNSYYCFFAGLLCGNSEGKGSNDVHVQGTLDVQYGMDSYIGGIYGWLKQGDINHCTAKVALNCSGSIAGVAGLCGRFGSSESNSNTMFDCAADVNINCQRNDTQYMGGIVGVLESKSIVKGCCSTGVMTGEIGTITGGICGIQQQDANVKACASTVTMTPSGYAKYLGGITGLMSHSNGHVTTIDGCVFSGYIDASSAMAAGGIVGLIDWDKDQHVSNSLFLGTLTPTANGTDYGAIVGSNDKPKETVGACYYDCQLFSDPIAQGCTSHPSVKAVSTRDLTSGKVNMVSMLPTDGSADYGFTLSEGFYPTVFCKNSSVLRSGAWLAAIPAVVEYGDCADDFVSNVTVNNHKGTWNEDNGRTVNINSTCVFPNTPSLIVSGQTATAKADGKCLLTINSRVSVNGGNTDRPAPIAGSRQVMLNVKVNQVWDGTTATACAAGTGKAEDPYIIKNGAQLAYAVNNNKVGEFYEQICDIRLNKDAVGEYGTGTTNINKWDFHGNWNASYDGRGHFVRGAMILGGTFNGYALFGNISADGSVTSLGLVESSFNGMCGGLAYKMDGKISNCIVQGVYTSLPLDPNKDGRYDRGHAGGICYAVGSTNTAAVVEDCVAAVYSISFLSDYTPFVCLSATHKGTVRNCLAVVPTAFADLNFTNRETFSCGGHGFIKDCYWLKGYEESGNGNTLDEICQALGKRNLWVLPGSSTPQLSNSSTSRYFPMLSTFAETDMGKLLSIPVRTDIDYNAGKFLLGFNHHLTFEPGQATWTSIANELDVEADGDMGIIIPVRASFVIGEEVHNPKVRNMSGVNFLKAQYGGSTIFIPMRASDVDVSPGISFVDDYARQACLDAFDTNHNGHLSLAELKAVTNEQTLTAFQTWQARRIQQFPEFRFFKNVTELTSQLNGMSSLEEVTLPYALQTIGSEAFKGCSSLEEVTVSSNVKTVKPRAFYGSAVENIIVDPFNETFESRDGVLFTQMDVLVAYPNGRDSEEVAITGTVERMAEGSFYKVPGLKRIFFDTTDYTTVPELADGAIVPELPSSSTSQLLDVYVSDATKDRTLINAYLSEPSWAEYVKAGKLHQYFPLKVPENVTTTIDGKKRYVGTFYIGFATQLPEELTPYVVNSLDAENYTAYVHEKTRFVPATQPVMVFADRPGLFRLTPIEGTVERWPVHANWLIGVERDPMRLNQGTSAQGSILTPQMNDEGKLTFLYEKKKQIDPYHCYLTFPTIDQSAELVRNAHYDIVYSEKRDGLVTHDAFTFDIRHLLPEGDPYAVLTGYKGEGGNIKVPASVASEWGDALVTQIAPNAFSGSKGDIWSIDMSELGDLEPLNAARASQPASAPFARLDPRTIVYLPKLKATPADNVVIGDECQKLSLTDGWDFCPPYEFHAQEATYDRVLRAIDNGNGTWTSKAYTLCLPFAVDIEELMGNYTDAEAHTLYYVNTDFTNKQFDFAFHFHYPQLEAGGAYLIVVKKGELNIHVNDVDVATSTEDWNVFGWKSTDIIGSWHGTFSRISNDEAAASWAYHLNTDGKFRRISNEKEEYRVAYIAPFRAAYFANEFSGRNTYNVRYADVYFGGADDPEFQDKIIDFPIDEYEGDGDYALYDEEEATGVSEIVNHKSENSKYYDLQGRSLKGNPAKGIFIYNGRKIVK